MEQIEQPKVFIGYHHELRWMARKHNWNIHKIALVSTPSGLYRLRGIKLKKSDIYYGETINEMHPKDLGDIYEELSVYMFEEENSG